MLVSHISLPFLSLCISLSSLQSCLSSPVNKTKKLPPRRPAKVTATFACASPSRGEASESVAILCVPESVTVFCVPESIVIFLAVFLVFHHRSQPLPSGNSLPVISNCGMLVLALLSLCLKWEVLFITFPRNIIAAWNWFRSYVLFLLVDHCSFILVKALQTLKKALGLPPRFGWNGDPCVPQQHPWIEADCQLNKSSSKWLIDGL
ncbi:hypothetical protein Ahy_A06g027270 isoform A [Arachis hypogaea]|uniref:Uncharacterized protein n=1 Tax=Arachis hypogaea TaxID=3818 RepID=A0A445CN59_ARAHY|nr:hypothetical protein Ahy_A06g027270 isoform A [Arachis hypogaea]